jgi:hypothetical protein
MWGRGSKEETIRSLVYKNMLLAHVGIRSLESFRLLFFGACAGPVIVLSALPQSVECFLLIAGHQLLHGTGAESCSQA